MALEQSTDCGLRELALFAGAGGGILGGKLLGWRCVCAVEIDPYARAVLAARQNDGCLDPFPIWDDVRTFDGKPWNGLVDVVSGGFPCQDISAAGRGEGINGDRSGLWKEFARIIREVGPQFAFVENSPMLTSRGLGRVLGDLAAMGYDAKWGVLGAVHTGAPHKRERIWIVAHAQNFRPGRRQQFEDGGEGSRDVADPPSFRRQKGWPKSTQARTLPGTSIGSASIAEPGPDFSDSHGDVVRAQSESEFRREHSALSSDDGQSGSLAHATRVQQGRPQQWAKRE